MPENDRGIGSEGLEQGGPNLGNDYTRPSASDTHTPDTMIFVKKNQKTGVQEADKLNMDKESNRNLTTNAAGRSDDMENDEELNDLDTDEEDDLDEVEIDEDDTDDDEENDII